LVGVLAAEGAAAVSATAAVGIDDDFPPGQAANRRAARLEEAAGWIDVAADLVVAEVVHGHLRHKELDLPLSRSCLSARSVGRISFWISTSRASSEK